MGPIDYTMQVLNPVQSLLDGYAQRLGQENAVRQMDQQDVSLGQGQQRIDMAQEQMLYERQQAERARAMQEAEIARQREAQRTFADFLIKPNKTYDDVVRIAQSNPEVAQAAVEYWGNVEEANKAGEVSFAKGTIAALKNNPQIAKDRIQARVDDFEAKGDKQNADLWRSQLALLDAGEEGRNIVMGNALVLLNENLSPNEMKTLMETVGLSAPKMDPKTEAEIKKIQAETDKINREMAAGPDKGATFDAEKKIRDEYSKLTGDFVAVRDAYRRVNASQDSAAGDLSMIFGYMKMLDPGSVVRESEFATAQNAAGVPDQIRNLYNRALSGERLNPDQRNMFRAQAEELMSAAQLREEEVRKGLMPTVQEYGLDENRVFGISGGMGSVTPSQQTGAPSQQSVAPDIAAVHRKVADAFRANGNKPLTSGELRQILSPEEFDYYMSQVSKAP